MTSKQYEEFCRLYLAEQLGVGVDTIRSGHIENPRRTHLPEFDHQIDLYWETEDDIVLYLNIANAKWRGDRKVEQGEVLLLQQVKTGIDAHKAVMLTSTGFTDGAMAAAIHHRIALHLVLPNFDYSGLDTKDAGLIRSGIREAASKQTEPLYKNEIVHKAFDLATLTTKACGPAQGPEMPAAGVPPTYSHKMLTGYPTKNITTSNKSLGGPKRGGLGGNKGGGSGYRKK
jgi:hypothetical protein